MENRLDYLQRKIDQETKNGVYSDYANYLMDAWHAERESQILESRKAHRLV